MTEPEPQREDVEQSKQAAKISNRASCTAAIAQKRDAAGRQLAGQRHVVPKRYQRPRRHHPTLAEMTSFSPEIKFIPSDLAEPSYRRTCSLSTELIPPNSAPRHGKPLPNPITSFRSTTSQAWPPGPQHLTLMAKKRTVATITPASSSNEVTKSPREDLLTPHHSEITDRVRPPPLNGHDRLLPNLRPAAGVQTPELPEVRSRRYVLSSSYYPLGPGELDVEEGRELGPDRAPQEQYFWVWADITGAQEADRCAQCGRRSSFLSRSAAGSDWGRNEGIQRSSTSIRLGEHIQHFRVRSMSRAFGVSLAAGSFRET